MAKKKAEKPAEAKDATAKTTAKPEVKEKKSANSTHIKPELPFWRIVAIIVCLAIWTVAVLIACQYAISYGMYFILGREQLLTPVWTTVCNALIYSLATFLIIWVPVRFFKKKKLTREELGFRDLPTWTDILLAPAGFIVYLIIAAGLVALFSNFSFFDIAEKQELGYTLNTGIDRLIAFFALCIVAPIAEEVIFRGWLYHKLRSTIPGKALSIIVSTLIVSIIFGVLHGQWNVGVNVFAMSLVLCGIREVTGTIYAGILLHMLKNSVAFVLVYILGMGG